MIDKTKSGPKEPKARASTPAEQKAAALRANLNRRKAQKRARHAQPLDETKQDS